MFKTLTQELINYCNSVISDNILSCQKHKWACERFLCDLQRQKTEEFPFIFVEQKAERFFTWMGFFKHTKGPLADTYKIPHIVEKFVFGQIYGWVYKDSRLRRFRTLYWQVARKNAKSQDLAILGTYEQGAFGEPCSEVIVAATKKAQTKYVWGEADLILRRCKLLKRKFFVKSGIIHHIKSESTFSRMSKDDAKKDDGSNPQCGILDEYHAHETDDYYNVLSSGMKTRLQPLLAIITTAGFDLNNPCYRDEYDYVGKILNPENPIENDRYFALVCELDKDEEGKIIDDITKPEVWIKSNPILGETEVGLQSLKAELKIAQGKPEKMRDFLTKSMNVWLNMKTCGYLDVIRWGNCKGVIPDLRGKKCYVGVDLSARLDLTSCDFEFIYDDLYIILSHSFMPREKYDEKMKEDKVPYDRWADEGWLSLTPGAGVDYKYVKNWMKEKLSKEGWGVYEFCFDPWNSSQMAQDLMEDGFECVEIVQGIKTLSEPTKDFKEMVLDKRVLHDGNSVLAFAVGNAIIDIVDRNENIILSKKKAKERIDPITCVINSHTRAMVHVENTGAGTY